MKHVEKERLATPVRLETLDEMRREAKRLDRPLNWLVDVAWQIARDRVRAFPAPLALLVLLACSGAPVGQTITVDAGAVTPAASYDLQSVMSRALACDAASLTWSIQEAGNAGFVSPRDGAISSAGVYTAPSCGSVYVGAIQHVLASGCGKTGSAQIATAQEVVNTVAIAAAVLNPGTSAACLARDPLNVSIPIGGTVAFYARIDLTCSAVFSPSLPVPMPALCAN